MSNSSVDISNTDLYDPAIIECPWHYDAALRAEAPVFHDKKNDILIVSNYELIKQVIHDPDTYSNNVLEKFMSKEPFPDEIMAIYAKGYPLGEALVVSDGDIHDRHRRIATRVLTRKRLEEYAPLLAEKTAALIDNVIDKGTMEFVSEIGEPLPLNLLQQQLVIPDEDMERAAEWSQALEPGSTTSLEAMRYQAEKIVECQLYFVAKIEKEMERIKLTGQGERDDSFITQIAQAVIDPDDPMDMSEAMSFIVNLFPANNGTTTLALTACMHRFTEHPEIQARIAEDPGLISKLIEETMRHESPNRGFFRRATKNTTLAGVEVPAGRWVYLRVSSAHRDECAYANPDVFDIDRKSSSPHMGFSTGIHICAGRAFARRTITEVLTQLSQRASDFAFIEGANSFEHTYNVIMPRFKELHIKFTPGR